MNERLRPSTLGEILDRTFHLYRNHFWRFVGVGVLPMLLALLVAIPVAALLAFMGIAGRAGADSVIAIRIITGIFYVVFLPFYLGAVGISIAGITEGAVLAQRGGMFTIRGMLKTVWPRFWTYLWYMPLQAFWVAVVPFCAAGILIAPLIYLMVRSGAGIGAGIVFGFLVFAIGAAAVGVVIWLFLSFAMGMAACVVEKKTAWDSLKRAWRLSQGTRGRIFVLYLLIFTLQGAAIMISYFLILVIIVFASLAGRNPAAMAVAISIGMVVYLVGAFGSQVALLPVPWIALTLFYFDQRVRKEGYDIEWMMQQAGLTEAPAADGAGFPPVTPPDTLREP